MAKSNADRQREFRERNKASLSRLDINIATETNFQINKILNSIYPNVTKKELLELIIANVEKKLEDQSIKTITIEQFKKLID